MVVDQVSAYLTFGRTRLFVFSSLSGLGAFGITFIGREVVIPVSEGGGPVVGVAAVLSAVFLVGAFWAVSSLGTLTYSPRFHRPRHVAISFVLYVIVAAVLVSLGYLVFVYTYAEQMPRTRPELAIGGLLVSFIAFTLAATHYGIVRRECDFRAKQQLISEVLDTMDAAATCDRDKLPEYVRTLGSTLKELEQHLQEEPMPECSELQSVVAEWRSSLTDATVSGAQKMMDESVLYGEHEVVDTDPHWSDKRTDFRHIHNDLHDMRDSALHKLIH